MDIEDERFIQQVLQKTKQFFRLDSLAFHRKCQLLRWRTRPQRNGRHYDEHIII